MQKLSRSIKPILFFTLVSTLISCSAQHADKSGSALDSATTAGNAAQKQAFQSTVYSFGRTTGCISCHSNYVNPQWMNPDLSAAYSFARPLLNLQEPTNSIFATYVANGHCGNAICSNPANVPIMEDLLSQWAAIEVNQTSGTAPPASAGSALPNPTFVTTTLAIPTPLPLLTSGKQAVIRFDLSQLQPGVAALNGVTLELSIEAYNTAGTTYRIFNPRIAGNRAAITLTGLHVYVRPAAGTGIGTEDLKQGLLWSKLTVVGQPANLPATMPTGPMTSITPLTSIALGVTSQSATDVITIGLESIQ